MGPPSPNNFKIQFYDLSVKVNLYIEEIIICIGFRDIIVVHKFETFS